MSIIVQSTRTTLPMITMIRIFKRSIKKQKSYRHNLDFFRFYLHLFLALVLDMGQDSALDRDMVMDIGDIDLDRGLAIGQDFTGIVQDHGTVMVKAMGDKYIR